MKCSILALAVSSLLAAQQPVDWRAQGKVLKLKGDASGALSAFQHAAESEPKAADIQDEIGFLLAVQGRQLEAVSRFESSIALNPSYAPAHYHLGVALWLLKDPGKAIQ